MSVEKSAELYKEALRIIPGGVNSPVRACKSVGIQPLFIERAQGSKLFDVDGNSYIDYVGSWGPMILGHGNPFVNRALSLAIERGTSYGAPTEREIELARMIVEMVPCVDVVRMVNSGTEATMSAIRLARAFTGRDMIIKFDGCYHGHADSFLVEAGSGVATLGIAGSPGVPKDVIRHTLSIPYNDSQKFRRVMSDLGDNVACVIVEPVVGNMGLVLPAPGFLETLREVTQIHGSLLVFDEVMTGFRVAPGGAQERYGIMPDLTTLGKVIGGGLPVGAYGGRKDIMEQIAPQGPVYQAGTLSGNPLAMTAGIETLKQLKIPGFYESLFKKTDTLIKGLGEILNRLGIPARASCVGSMMGLFFTDREVLNFQDAKTCDLKLFSAYYRGMRDKGIYLAPSQFEAGFMSAAHSDEDIAVTLAAAEDVLTKIKD
ncbi:MAG: glutamate-1-semialdehyde 2,1-aminomutase [Proteobacteria bacterium]|nr:glutamate-1-semialdehyde 2,1-aminomutase [Pseudomonadota bacterium]